MSGSPLTDRAGAVPRIEGVHHVKFPVSDVEVSHPWYCGVFRTGVALEFRDEPDGPVRGVALEPVGGVMIALREHPSAAAAIAGFDPVAFAVADRNALNSWIEHLDGLGVEHSPVVDATIGWLVAFHDPDGIEIRLYTLERHDMDPGWRRGESEAAGFAAGAS